MNQNERYEITGRIVSELAKLLSVGFSGFRGETDINIVLEACKNLELI